MAEIPFPTSLMPQYQSPQQMALSAAETQDTQATAQGKQIANQGAQLKLGLLQDYLAAPAGGSPASDVATPAGGNNPAAGGGGIGQSGVDPDTITSHAINQFAPLPTARPTSVIAQMNRATMAGLPEVAANIGAQYDAQVTGANQKRALGANAAYQGAASVADAPDGTALSVLDKINPNAAAGLQAAHPDHSDAQLDSDARDLAKHIAHATYQYSGRDSEFQNGMQVDKKSGAKVTGSEQILTGLDGAGKQKAFDSANELVTVHNSDGSDSQVPRFRQAGYPSAAAFVIAADRSARSSATTPPTAAGAAPPAGGNTTAAPKSAPAPAPSAATTVDPQLKAMLTDPAYKLKTPTVRSGVTPTPAELEQQKASVTARTDLLKDSQDATLAASQSLQYLQAAKSIMDSKGATTGAYGGLVAKLSALFPGEHIDASNYQELAKYLGNAALANAKGIYGQRMTQSEVGLQLNELSPSVHMTDSTVNNLIDSNIKSAKYSIDSARRVPKYLANGGDPQLFAQANQQYFDRAKTVNAPTRPGQQSSGGGVQDGAKSVSKSGKPIVFSNGHWQYQ